MLGWPASRTQTSWRRASWLTALLVALLTSSALLPASALVARAAVAAAPAHADAADFVPTVANLPPGFREDWTDAVGGDIQPTAAMRRAFVALDNSRRLVVGVAINATDAEAQTTMDTQVNNLSRFQGWRFTSSNAYGESGFRGTRTNPDGGTGTMALYRVQAVTAEIAVYTEGGVNDISLVDNVARLVHERIETDPDVVTARAGWTRDPVVVPGKDPVVPVAAISLANTQGAPGAEVTGSSSGSPVSGDTIVLLSVTAIDRPWSGGNAPRPPAGMEYITAELLIETQGSTEAITALTDFSINTYDGRFWTPVPARSPGLRIGNVTMSAPARGWLSFMVPVDQPALQLNWRLRINQPTATGSDQTIVVPLVAGASAQASVGATPPPAGQPVSPPSTSPGAPTSPSAPAPAPAATPTGGGSGSGGGGGGGAGGRPRLQ